MKSKELKSRIKVITVGSGNFLSQLFFAWVFPFVWTLRRTKDIKLVSLILRVSESALLNEKLLDEKWSKEIDSKYCIYVYYNRIKILKRSSLIIILD
jgi:hypothetical protein